MIKPNKTLPEVAGPDAHIPKCFKGGDGRSEEASLSVGTLHYPTRPFIYKKRPGGDVERDPSTIGPRKRARAIVKFEFCNRPGESSAYDEKSEERSYREPTRI